MDAALPLSEVHVATGLPPSDVESASAEIRAVFASMAAERVPDDLDFVQEGTALGACLRESRLDLAGHVYSSFRVREIFFLNELSAVVRCSVDLPRSGASSRSSSGPRRQTERAGFVLEGRAVRQDGRWLMERGTFCDLVGRAGVQCPPLRAR